MYNVGEFYIKGAFNRFMSKVLSIGEKIKQVFIQILWLPISFLFSLMALSLLLFVSCFIGGFFGIFFVLEGMGETGAMIRQYIMSTSMYALIFCWLPYVLYKYVIFPKLKGFQPKRGRDYNVGASYNVTEHDVQREVRDSQGKLVGHVKGTEYKVDYDNGDRYEMSGDEMKIMWLYCPLTFFMRIISLLASIVAIFVPRMGVMLKAPPFAICSSPALFIWLDIFFVS